MDDYSLWVELDTDPGSDAEFARVALEWLDEGSRLRLAEARELLAADPDAPWKVPADPDAAWGRPCGAWGVVSVARERGGGPPRLVEKSASTKGWSWLADQLQGPVWSAGVTLYLLGEDGKPDRGVCHIQVMGSSKTPGWIRLCTRFSSSWFTDEGAGIAEQRAWLDFLRQYADQINPAYGQIGVMHNYGDTTLEYSLPVDFGRNSPPNSVGESRQALRGYAWLTVVAQELAERLGGAGALAAGGVFFDVVALAHGGVWLQATEDYRDYDQAKAEQIFRVLAPVLRSGKPAPRVDAQTGRPHDDVPYLVVYEDAAAVAGQPG